MVMDGLIKKNTLICKCRKIPVSSEVIAVSKDCKCKTDDRKSREFEKVILETEGDF